MKRFYLFIGLFTCFSLALHSQITFTYQDLLDMRGTSFLQIEDERTSIPVNVGSPGANQVWDLRDVQIVDTVLALNEFMMPAGSPYVDSFPEANFLQRISSPTTEGFTLYSYNKVTESEYISLGGASEISFFGDSTIFSFEQDTLAFLPLEYGKSFMTVENDTTDLGGIFVTISSDTTIYTVDGWGTVRIPAGDFECLRLRQDVRSVTREEISGIPTSFDFETFIQYDWIAKDYYLLARAQSQFGNTDSNFTDATGFGRLFSLMTTSIDEQQNQLSAFTLFPNPANEGLSLSFDLKEAQEVEIRIQDLMGRTIDHMPASHYAPGEHRLSWDLRENTLKTGLYIVSIRSGEKVLGSQLFHKL